MKLPPFKLEEYFEAWEFKAPYLMAQSDVESWSLEALLALADQQCLDLWKNLSLGYTETQGHPLLRQEIKKLYEEAFVLPCAGAEEAILWSMTALVNQGDHVVVITPCYQSLLSLPQALGGEVTEVELIFEENWELDLDRFERALRPNTKLIVINYPHNPTGALLSKEAQRALVEMARARGIFILSDEVYTFLEIDPRDRLPPIADLYERGVSINVLSKAFGLPGLRLGWVATKDAALFEKIKGLKHYGSICLSAPSEILGIVALRNRKSILNHNRKIVLENFALLTTFFEKHNDLLAWVPTRGGCIAFPKLLSNEPIDTFTKRLVKEKGVLLLPGSVYDAKGNHFRIGFGRKSLVIEPDFMA